MRAQKIAAQARRMLRGYRALRPPVQSLNRLAVLGPRSVSAQLGRWRGAGRGSGIEGEWGERAPAAHALRLFRVAQHLSAERWLTRSLADSVSARRARDWGD